MATKLTFRARTLDATKPMAIYRAEHLLELADSNAINRSVPAMPSGMEKEEESEKHLQDILDAQSRNRDDPNYIPTPIPTPEVFAEENLEGIYKGLYKGEYRTPRAYIHVQPFTADADQPAYDMDEEDERFIEEVSSTFYSRFTWNFLVVALKVPYVVIYVFIYHLFSYSLYEASGNLRWMT